jgi:hypothetical protein
MGYAEDLEGYSGTLIQQKHLTKALKIAKQRILTLHKILDREHNYSFKTLSVIDRALGIKPLSITKVEPLNQ